MNIKAITVQGLTDLKNAWINYAKILFCNRQIFLKPILSPQSLVFCPYFFALCQFRKFLCDKMVSFPSSCYVVNNCMHLYLKLGRIYNFSEIIQKNENEI